MTSNSRPPVPSLEVSSSTSTALLLRILERPGLVAAVRALPGAVLGQLIERVGLEDAGALVALASTEQLERIFDADLWRPDRAGGDETFRPERFALWLRVMLEAGEAPTVQRLCELPQDLVALAVHRLVLVVDIDLLDEQLAPGDEEAEAIAGALENSVCEEWEEFRVIARDPDAWDDVWCALIALDRDHHDRLRALFERCRDLTLEHISGQGGLYQVLTADEMLDSDVAAARDDRRVAEGFISPADARAFLALARQRAGGEERDPITRAYFRGMRETAAPATARPRGKRRAAEAVRDPRPDPAGPADVHELTALLQAAEVIPPSAAQPLAALTAIAEDPPSGRTTMPAPDHLVAPLFEQAMRDLRQSNPGRFDERVREVGYLVNVWMAGGAHEGRQPRPAEALDTVLRTCEAGLESRLTAGNATAADALAVLAQTPADVLFRRR